MQERLLLTNYLKEWICNLLLTLWIWLLPTEENLRRIIFRSDSGAQFTSKCFQKYLDALNMIQSFSAKSHPYENAVMECFSNV